MPDFRAVMRAVILVLGLLLIYGMIHAVITYQKDFSALVTQENS
jgi:hypothetical protein